MKKEDNSPLPTFSRDQGIARWLERLDWIVSTGFGFGSRVPVVSVNPSYERRIWFPNHTVTEQASGVGGLLLRMGHKGKKRVRWVYHTLHIHWVRWVEPAWINTWCEPWKQEWFAVVWTHSVRTGWCALSGDSHDGNTWFASVSPVKRGYDTLNGRRTFGVVFLILKGRQLCVHCSVSEWSFATKQISVTRITTAQMAQIEIKRNLITKT